MKVSVIQGNAGAAWVLDDRLQHQAGRDFHSTIGYERWDRGNRKVFLEHVKGEK
jgi:hypothetical protein